MLDVTTAPTRVTRNPTNHRKKVSATTTASLPPTPYALLPGREAARGGATR